MKKILSILYIFFAVQFLFAQDVQLASNTGAISFSTKDASWSLTQYAPNIVKVVYTPKAYTTNENISDAVLLKPLNTMVKQWYSNNSFNRSIQWKDFAVEVKDDTLYFGPKKTVALKPAFANKEFKGFEFKLGEEEKIFGGGERALPLNRRGYKFNLYNNPWYGYNEGADNLNYSVPFFTSSNGYGLFFDNPSKGYVDIGKTNTSMFEVGFSSGQLNVYIILGKTYEEILLSYHKLTGNQPLPPRWAMGNLMSRFGYTSEAQVTSIAAKMKVAQIPIDAIIFDLFWFGDSIKSTMGNLDWVNKKAWPSPTKMIQGFKKEDIQTVLITEPFVLKSSLNYENSKQFHAVDSAGKPYVLKDFYFGAGGIVDIFRKDAQQWFWSKHEAQMKRGVEAWWGDLGEPEKHPADLLHNLKDLGFKRLFKADEVHNLYGHTWTKMLYNQYAKNYPTKRLFSLNRSGFAGSQRYNIFPWTGDVSRSWGGLNAQLPIILGMSMSGVPYVHSDAGGFAGGNGDNELYVRWLQMAAFTPIFRPHGTALYEVDKNAFSFPSEAALIEEPFQSYAKKAIDLRYELLPYNYNLAYLQSKYGKPLIMPMYYLNPKDSFATSITDQFYWGENIVVAPILQKGSTSRSVYLPEANNVYYKYKSSTTYLQGIITDTASIGNQLLYVKAGSIIPTWLQPVGANTAKYSTNQIQWQYYATNTNGKQSFNLFNDDGITKNAVANFINCAINEKEMGFEIIVSSSNQMKNNAKTANYFSIVLYGLKQLPTELLLNNIVLDNTKWSVNKNTNELIIQLNYTGNRIQIQSK
jgi:oligosaccharide 4-alpha-D-glucosyltransferase